EEEKNRPLDHYLLVFDGGGNRIHQDLLAGGILQPAMDTFFVMNDRLYYIKSKAEILAIYYNCQRSETSRLHERGLYEKIQHTTDRYTMLHRKCGSKSHAPLGNCKRFVGNRDVQGRKSSHA